MQRTETALAYLQTAIANNEREVRVSVVQQKEKARRRSQPVRTVELTFELLEGKQPEMGITLAYVQQKVKEAVDRRDALRKVAETRAPIYTDYPAMVIRDMQECLEVLRLIKAQTESLREHIRKNSKQPNMEQELRALISELTI